MEDNINKYYTPEAEEFYIGFEFEYMSVETNGWVSIDKDMWLRPKGAEETHLLRSVNEWDRCIKHADLTKVRVKYLDKEDIESLGFIYKGKSIDNWYYMNGNFERPLSNHRNMSTSIQHDFRDNEGIVIRGFEWSDINGENEVLYRGSCKNKSELIKILKNTNVYGKN